MDYTRYLRPHKQAKLGSANQHRHHLHQSQSTFYASDTHLPTLHHSPLQTTPFAPTLRTPSSWSKSGAAMPSYAEYGHARGHVSENDDSPGPSRRGRVNEFPDARQGQGQAAPIARNRAYRPKSNYVEYKRRVVTDDDQMIDTQQFAVGRSHFYDDRDKLI